MYKKYDDPKMGQKFNKWEVIDDTIVYYKDRYRSVMCRCECGRTTKLIATIDLNKYKAIGCKICALERLPKYKDYVIGNLLYGKWVSMIKRCTIVNNDSYYRYGGRGITVCEEWRNDFTNFQNWALENGYQDNLQIDRIDNDGNYEPSNCRWITRVQNSYNKGSKPNSSSKYKGVSISKKNAITAAISCQGRHYWLGTFKNEEEAALAYNEKAKELFGEFAYLNKIEDNKE